MTPVPTITLADAISGAEQADSTYQKSVAQTDADQQLAAAAQAKADAAKDVVTLDQGAQTTAARQRNAAFRLAIKVFAASIIPDVDLPEDPPNPPAL